MVSCTGTAQDEADEITADRLLDDVLRRLPRVPLCIDGELHVRRPRGVVVQDLTFQMNLDWGAEPAEATYLIRDPAGQPLESLTLTRSAGGPPQATHTDGASSEVRPLEDLAASIQQTDLTWMDLTLSFLWWRGGTVKGRDEVRGRPAYIVDLPAPTGESSDTYASVRVWIDEKARMLLQAQGFTAEGTLARTLWVKSFKKIEDRWMIKDLEVQRYPVVHRTKVRVHSVKEVAASDGHESDSDH